MSAFRNTLIQDIVKDLPDILYVKHSDSIAKTLDLLLQNHVQSVGIYCDTETCFIGLVSVLDIMTWVALAFYPLDDPDSEVKAQRSLDKPIGEIHGIFHEETRKIWNFEKDMTLGEILEPFSKGVHRAVVALSDDKFKIITQTDVIRFAFAKKDQFPEFAKTVEELKLGGCPNDLYTLKSNETALMGFRKMDMEYYFAVPIVDPDTGVLVGTLSASDIRNVSPDNIHQVKLPVKEFLTKFREPVVAKKGTTMETIVRNILTSGVHRVWLVDDGNKPIGVVSLSDIISRLYKVSV